MDAKEYGAMINKYAASGAVAVSIYLAKEVGILDILYQAEEPLTTQQIAARGDLKERYVREVIGALVTGDVVQVDQSSSVFHIKPEHKAALKATAPLTGFPVYFGQKFKAVKECFPKNGPSGVRFSDYPDIFKVMEELKAQSQDKLVEDDILPAHPPLAGKLEAGIEALEIGSGNGVILLNICKRFPKTNFTGSDVVESALVTGRERAAELGVKNCIFSELDVCKVPEHPDKQYDWVYAQDVIHDLPNPQEAINGIYRMLKPGGILTMIDPFMDGTMAENAGKLGTGFFFATGLFVCVPDSYQGGDSTALGPCSDTIAAKARMTDAGFSVLNMKRNKQAVVFVCQKPE